MIVIKGLNVTTYMKKIIKNKSLIFVYSYIFTLIYINHLILFILKKCFSIIIFSFCCDFQYIALNFFYNLIYL